MSLLFWRKKSNTDESSVAVTTTDPLPVRIMSDEDDEPARVQIDGIAPVRDEPLIPFGKQTGLSVAASAVGLTIPAGGQPKQALIQVFTAPIRFWVDGSVPTATTGHRVDYYDVVELAGYNEIANFRAIRESGTSATLEVTFYG